MRTQQDFFNGQRGVECPKCHRTVTIYTKGEAHDVKAHGCMECQNESGDRGEGGEDNEGNFLNPDFSA